VTERALILGAKSVIAQALARRLSRAGSDLVLAARQCQELLPFASDLTLETGRRVDLVEFDLLRAHDTLANGVQSKFGDFELVIMVVGYLGQHQKAISGDEEEIELILQTNFTGAVQVLSKLANYLEGRGTAGGMIGITSVAGDRGRQSNYLYGAAKGGLALFLQGLRNRLAASDVHVMTVKPGFVDTPMTENMEGLFLVASPERVAHDIISAYEKKRDIIYTPWFWKYIMLAIKSVPERIFKRLKL
jgi:decaprenylphospho-beta-D-erythro-pentofuranosid-2-ulose 2-reductase